jgi:RNA polymerase sigma factor (sigma-70 family)
MIWVMHSRPAPIGHPDSRATLPVRLGAVVGDERLAHQTARGSERAFATIYERYHQRLYRYCRSIVQNDVDAQDALQSTFASAFAALQRDQRDAPLRPWLFRIAHNEAISLIRRRGDTREFTEAHSTPVPSAADRAGERARLAMLVADLEDLPERQRGALLMRELSGLSHDEIAIALDTSPGAAKQAIFEARRALQEYEQGRLMACEDVRRAISDGDGRRLRGRRVRGHLRDCAVCAAFAEAIPDRRAQLQALAPTLPLALAAGVLPRLPAGGSVHGTGGGLVASGIGKAVGTSIGAKALAGAAVIATAAAGATATLTLSRHDDRRPAKATNAQSAPAVSRRPGGQAAKGSGVAAAGRGAHGSGAIGAPSAVSSAGGPRSTARAHGLESHGSAALHRDAARGRAGSHGAAAPRARRRSGSPRGGGSSSAGSTPRRPTRPTPTTGRHTAGGSQSRTSGESAQPVRNAQAGANARGTSAPAAVLSSELARPISPALER